MGCLFSDPYDEEAAAAAAAARDPGSVRRTAPGPSGRPAPGPIQRSIASLPPTVVMPSPARPPPPVEPRRESAPATQPPQSEPKPVISQPRRDSGLAPADRRNSASGSQAITRAELAQHGKSSTEPWTAIKGLVYDLSGFLSKHPGGRGALLMAAGRDGTADFRDAHSYVNPANTPQLKLIGKLEV